MAIKPTPVTPGDYLKGSRVSGQKYTAWDTYGQGRPDFGKGNNGPGTPYHEVSKTVPWPSVGNPHPTSPPGIPWGQIANIGGLGDPRLRQNPHPVNPPTYPWGKQPSSPGSQNSTFNARLNAIQKRLGWGGA